MAGARIGVRIGTLSGIRIGQGHGTVPAGMILGMAPGTDRAGTTRSGVIRSITDPGTLITRIILSERTTAGRAFMSPVQLQWARERGVPDTITAEAVM